MYNRKLSKPIVYDLPKIVVDHKPWGLFRQFTFNEKSTVKILEVNPNQTLSLQYHKKREEMWYVLEGPAKVVLGVGGEIIGRGRNSFIEKSVDSGQIINIPKGMIHRLGAYDKPVKVLEIAFGDFDENDIVRLEDDYGRKS